MHSGNAVIVERKELLSGGSFASVQPVALSSWIFRELCATRGFPVSRHIEYVVSMDNSTTQDFTQDLVYQGSRGPVEVRTMVVTYAVRSYDKLLRTHGHSILNTPLVQAIARRAQLEGSSATGVDVIAGEGHMLRGDDGRFVGKWVR